MTQAPHIRIVIAIAAAALAVAAFCCYAFLPLAAPLRFNSPDETANHAFAAHFARTGLLHRFEPLNVVAPGLIRPRSVAVIDDLQVPGGFIGLPVLYGMAAKAAGVGALPFMTPVVAALAVLAWGMLVAARFGRRTGAVAAALVAFHPAWWYVAARTMLPNALFMSLLVGAAWLFIAAPIRKAIASRPEPLPLLRRADAALAGILLGLALAVRMSEAYWLAAGGLAAALALRGRLPWGRIALAAAFCALTLAPFLALNAALYGGPLATGYAASPTEVPVAEVPGGMGARLIGPLGPVLFPLGFAPRTAFGHFAAYGLAFFPWWSAAALAASAFALARARGKALSDAAKAAAAFAAAGGAYLILFYGSWTFRDNPDPSAVTIGASYIRYWLPVFIASTVPVAWALSRAVERRKPRMAAAALAVVLAAYAAASGSAVFRAPQEGLLAVRATVIRDDARARAIIEATPERSLIVVDRADKILWPDRAVTYPLRDERTYAALGDLKKFAELYYYGITLPESDLAYLNGEKLPPLGLGIEEALSFGDETLYRFTGSGASPP
jgi:hypothetical protein